MSRREAALTVVQGLRADQVVRREQFEARHPRARIWREGPFLRGSLPVGSLGSVRYAPRCTDLEDLLDMMERLAALAAEAAAVEADFPGWHVWHCSGGRWWAARTGRVGRGDPRPMTVDADDSRGLRGELARAEARQSSAVMGTGRLA